MATFTQIKTVRLQIADPANVINILQVSSLPVTPAQQTAYYVTSTQFYMIHDGAAYVQAELRVSDEYLGTLIDTYGVALAVCRAYRMILAQLGNQLMLIRTQSGAESTQYQDLLKVMDYYRQMKEDCDEQNNKDNLNSTGRFYQTEQPDIAGGNL